MQVATFNVNGIRSVYEKGFLGWLNQKSFDILCLQETKAKLEQLPNDLKMKENLFEKKDYLAIFNSAEKEGYSGTAIYSKKEPENVEKLLGPDRFDKEGRFIAAEFKGFKLINVYMPHGGRDKENLDYKLEVYQRLLQYLRKHKEEQLILCGDFNIARDERDLARPEDNKNNIMFTPQEREQIQRLLKLGFRDTFRKTCQDSGHYTWFPYAYNAKKRNLGWRIDYIFISKSIELKLKDAFILKEVDMSDHCPMVMKINL